MDEMTVEEILDAARFVREGAGPTLFDAELAEPLATLLETTAEHLPVADPGREPRGCTLRGVSNGAGECDTWRNGLALARQIRVRRARLSLTS